MATLHVLYSFTGGPAYPTGDLIFSSDGNLIGTDSNGGSSDDGTVFELNLSDDVLTPLSAGFAGFNGTLGSDPNGTLVVDANNNVLGVTMNGGASGDGAIYEFVSSAGGYESPVDVASFSSTTGENPTGGLVADASGDLFGTTTTGGSGGGGTVFEVTDTAGSYSGTITPIVEFDNTSGAGTTGYDSQGPLIVDSAGDLFGTTIDGGANGDGTVFEVVKADTGYSSTPLVLANFSSAVGTQPYGGLAFDRAGDLFGTTSSGGLNGDGTIFEIENTASGYDAPEVLANFSSADGQGPHSTLLVDAAGDLFGTAEVGGTGEGLTSFGGTVFELQNTSEGYASSLTVLADFDGDNGSFASSNLTVDSSGDLYGTTDFGGPSRLGTIFEITDSGYQTVPCYCRGTAIQTDRGQTPVEDLEIGDLVLNKDGDWRPVKWIGRRSYGGRFVLGRKDILPICVKTGALADNVPKRDLWISPHHAMLLKGVLIEAKDLINGVSIVQAEHVEKVEYFHIELDSHDVIIAEGALSETFVDDDSRGMFHNAHEYDKLYGGEILPPARYCASRLDNGYEVEAVRHGIALRAGLLGTVRKPRAGALRGWVDAVNEKRIDGWAQNVHAPEVPVCLDIIADGRLIGQVLANIYREDLRRAGLGSGRHSFRFSPPAGIKLTLGGVEVRRSLDGALLKSSKQPHEQLPSPAMRRSDHQSTLDLAYQRAAQS